MLALNAKEPDEAAGILVQTSFKKGSDDNLTAVVVNFEWPKDV